MSLSEELADTIISKIPPPPEVVFPDVQKVEVTNFPEQKAPVVNVTVPEIKIPSITVPEPKVTVNVPDVVIPENTSQNAILGEIKALLAKEPAKFDEQSFFERLGEVLKDKVNIKEAMRGFQSSGWLPVVDAIDKSNYYSTANASTTAPGISGEYTGTWEDVTKYNSVVVAIATDKAGTYTIQFSPDGTNIDSTLTRYHKASEIHVPHRFTVTRRYFRVVFTNTSGEAQTYFRLQVLVGDKESLNAPLDGILAQDFDAIAVRPSDFRYESALGLREGNTTWSKFGYNSDVDTGTEVVAAFGGAFTFLTTASTLTIVSSSTNDDGSPAGTGAQLIYIQGIDANRKVQTETVTLDGTTPVVTSTTWLGINRVSVALAGSTQNNVGNITITATTGGTTQAYIPAGKGVTGQLIFFSQLQHKCLLDWVFLNANKNGPATPPIVTFKGWVYSPVSNGKYEIFTQDVNTNVDDHVEIAPPQPFILNSGDVFWIESTTDQNNTNVSGRFTLIEVKNVDAS